MKTIYLVRHAKAESKDSGIPDFERSLIDKGEKDTKAVSERLRREGLIPELIVSSPAIRAIETAQIFAKSYNYSPKNIKLEIDMYTEGYDAILKIIKNVSDKYRSVMLFGHDPSISELAGYLLKNYHSYISKSGVLCIDFQQGSWKNIERGQGTLWYSCSPEELKQRVPKFENLKEKQESEFLESLIAILAKNNINVPSKVQQLVGKEIKQLLVRFAKMVRRAR